MLIHYCSVDNRMSLFIYNRLGEIVNTVLTMIDLLICLNLTSNHKLTCHVQCTPMFGLVKVAATECVFQIDTVISTQVNIILK